MKKIITALLAAACAMVLSAPGFADEPYYIELGHQDSAQDAARDWQTLSDAHKKILSKLHYSPATVLQADHKEVTRIQAGPIDSRKKAEAICNHLFRQNTPCFVIEGLNHTTKSADNSAGTPLTSLPWHVERPLGSMQSQSQDIPPPPPVAEEKKPGFVILPWLKDKGEPAPLVAGEGGKVEVSEAIHVPLTDNDANPSDVRPGPATYTVPSETSSAGLSQTPGWLNVSAFDTEDDASSLWQQVRNTVPNLAAGMRVRIVHPLATRNEPSVVLNIGPFADESDAMTFCRSGIAQVNSALSCRFSEGEPAGTTEALPASRYSHADEYAARRDRFFSRHAPSDNPASQPAPQSSATGKLFWLQVSAADSQVDALKQWEDIRTNNSDLLDGVRSSVSAPLMGGQGGYVVRIGPLDSQEQATNLYRALMSRGVTSKIYSNM